MTDNDFEKLLVKFPHLKASIARDPKREAELRAKDFHQFCRFMDAADWSTVKIITPPK